MWDLIRQRRNDLRLTQREVADRLRMTAAAVAAWEAGTSIPRMKLVPALAEILQLDLGVLKDACFDAHFRGTTKPAA